MSVVVCGERVWHIDAHYAFDLGEWGLVFLPPISPIFVEMYVSETEMFVEYFVNLIDPLLKCEAVCVCGHNDLCVGEAEVLH
jgi:hypothetical protein